MAFFFFSLLTRQSLKRERKYFRKYHFCMLFFRSLFKTDSVCELIAFRLIQEADIFNSCMQKSNERCISNLIGKYCWHYATSQSYVRKRAFNFIRSTNSCHKLTQSSLQNEAQSFIHNHKKEYNYHYQSSAKTIGLSN